MLDKKLIPTPLIDPKSLPPIKLLPIPQPRRLPRWYFLRKSVAWVVTDLLLRLQGKHTPQLAGERLRQFLEDTGPLWIKLGQLLAVRTDLFAPDFCRELANLQYAAVGFPPEIARAVIEIELGAPVEHFFDDFEDAPFAAASIAQIHRARLRFTDIEVAIKVQRPDVRWRFEQDMKVVKPLFHFLQRRGVMSFMNWDEFMWEVEQVFREEGDYRYEAANIRRMRKSLRSHRVYVPQVFERLCTSKVLVMEYLPGVLMSDYRTVGQADPDRLQLWLKENNIDPALVGERLALSFFRQMLEDNLSHGDLHPGNIMLLRDSRMALIDLGSIGSLEKEMLQKTLELNRALADQEYEKAADLMLLLSPAIPMIDLTRVRSALVRAFRSWAIRTALRGLSYEEKSYGNMGMEASKVLMENRIAGSWAYIKISRAWATLDGTLSVLTPNINFSKILKKYFRQAEARAMKNMRGRRLKTLRYTLMHLTSIVAQVSEMLTYQRVSARRRANVFQSVTSKVSYLFSLLFRLLSYAVLFCWVLAIYQFIIDYVPELHPYVPYDKWLYDIAYTTPPWFYTFEEGVLGTIGAGLLYLLLLHLRRYFARPDVRLPDAAGQT